MKRRAKVSITAVVLTKNSAGTVQKCFKSLTWCDEIIVVDDFSADGTLAIAKKYSTRIYKRDLRADFAAQRNFGLAKAKGEWVLFLDSDEVISGPVVPSDEYTGYYLSRRDLWLGCEIKHGETNVKLLRLARKAAGKWKRRIHEYWDVPGRIGTVDDCEIVHYPHPSVGEFIAEVAGYSGLHALQNKKEGKEPSLLKVIFFPAFKFLNNFIFRLGFADGLHGLVIAGIMSFHSFLSWSELWLVSRKKRY